jgi:Fur family ferric uptake transcriptional regulator
MSEEVRARRMAVESKRYLLRRVMLSWVEAKRKRLQQHDRAFATSWHYSSAMARRMSATNTAVTERIRDELRSRGMRWTPQRRALIELLRDRDGHITVTELLELCRQRDPETTPSTVYRTLDVLEEIGLVRHSHGPDGREEFHIAPVAEHGHAVCQECGRVVELDEADVTDFEAKLAGRGFRVDLSHLTVGGLCSDCGAGVRPR